MVTGSGLPSRHRESLPERVTGAIIDEVELVGDTLVRLSFRHRGTDDDSGWLVVPAEYVRFEGEGGNQ